MAALYTGPVAACCEDMDASSMQRTAVSKVSVAAVWYIKHGIINAYAIESELCITKQSSQHRTADSKEHKHQVHKSDSRHNLEAQAQQEQSCTYMLSCFSCHNTSQWRGQCHGQHVESALRPQTIDIFTYHRTGYLESI